MTGSGGTLGAALSTAIWAAIAGAAWMRGVDMLSYRYGVRRAAAWVARVAGWVIVILIPQGIRLWWPRALVHRYLPHGLTVAELSFLVKIAAMAALVGMGAAALYRRIAKGPARRDHRGRR